MLTGYYLKYKLGKKQQNLIKLASVRVYSWVRNLKEFEKPCCRFSLSPHLTSLPSSFSLSVICQAAQLLALSPPAQDPLDFSPAKELCTVPQPRLLTAARLFPFLSLKLNLSLPRLLTPTISTSLFTLCF